jgi:membrane fusion protein, multidrug efflux system
MTKNSLFTPIAVLLTLCACSAPPNAGSTTGVGQGAAAQSASARPGQAPAPPVSVLRASVRSQEWVDEISALGTTAANESITLSAKVTETVARINFSDGDTVRAGDVLVELTGRAEVAALKEAQAAYLDADRQFERLDNIVKQGTVTRAQLDTQGAVRDQAQARREAIRARLSDRVILAPFSGVTGFRMVSPGALVTPGTAITTLDDIHVLKLDFSIPENQLGSVHVGDQVVAKSSAFPALSFVGKVVSIDSRIDTSTRAVKVRARLENPRADTSRTERETPNSYVLRPGMLLSVKLQAQTRQALTVAEIAVMQQAGQAFVYKVGANSSAERVNVNVGARRSGEAEITSGLVATDVVIGEGAMKLRPGQTVQLIDAATAAPLTVAPLPAATPSAPATNP